MSDMPSPPSERSPLTLYCLAHAGGSALPYTRWSRSLPASVTVEPLELPGHGSRLREPLRETLEELVEELTRSLRPRLSPPFALFGHSFGALLGYELARRLGQCDLPPSALLVAGRNGPSKPLSHRPLHGLPDETFLPALRRFGGLPDALLNQPELLRLYLPALRTDLRLVETYTRSPGPALEIPIVAFAGRRDVLTDPPGMLAWERETTGSFDLSLLPGGHFFLDSAAFLPALAASLLRHTPSDPPTGTAAADRVVSGMAPATSP